MTYSDGTLHEAARVQLFPGESMGNVIVPPFNLYYAVSVVAGKFRTGSPADLYAFRSWDGPKPDQAFLVLQDKQAEDVAPPRRRASGRPGISTAPATTGPLTLRIVPSYIDLSGVVAATAWTTPSNSSGTASSPTAPRRAARASTPSSRGTAR